MFKRLTVVFSIALFSISGMVLTSAEVLAQSRGGWSSRPTYTPPPPPPRVYQPPTAPRQVPVPPAGVSPYPYKTPGINTGPGIRPQPGANPQRGLLGGTRQPPSANPQGAGQLGKQGSSRQNLMSGTAISTGVVKAPHNPTPGEIQKGFTGRVTADGRALVKFQNRILTVPAARISGLSAKLANDNQRKPNWTPQRQSATNARIKAIASGNIATSNGGLLWSSTKNKPAVENALEHWNKHKSEFPEFQNAKQYAEGAKDFLTNPPKGTMTKTNSRGDMLRYDPSTNTFGVLSKDGAPRTMFRPKDGMDYWNRQ